MTGQEHNGRMLNELWELGESLFDPADWQGWLEGCCDHCGGAEGRLDGFCDECRPPDEDAA